MKKWFWLAAFALILIAAYSALGILQAGSIYEGERALRNLRFWGSIMISSLIGAGVCIVFALRSGPFVSPAAWLGFVAGLLTGLVLACVILVYAGNFDAHLTVNPLIDHRPSIDADTWVWKSIQALCFFAAMASGAVAAKWSPRRSWGATATLVCLVLVVNIFSQFPLHFSPLRLAIWALAEPLGLITGALLYNRRNRAVAEVIDQDKEASY